MRRYDHNEERDEYCMTQCENGDWVKYDEAQAAIASLTAEVDECRIIIERIAYAAHNDAIEAAYKCADQDSSAYHIRQDIRALKHPKE